MSTFDSFQTLLDQATGVQPATPIDTKMNVLDRAGQIKKNQVAQASARKQEAMGAGVDSAYNIALSKLSSLGTLGRSDKENDLREMTPGQLYQKYGDQAGTLIKQLAQGTNAVMDTMNTPDRNAGQVVYDGATDIASGFGNALGGVAALGVGTVTSRGGAAISRELEEATRLNAAYQSDELRVRKQLAEDKNALAGRDNIEQRAADISNGDSELIAGLKSIGREAVNAVSIAGSDSAVLGSGVSNAVGSLLAAGPVSKGVSGLAGLAKLEKIGSKIATPVAIGAMESGGSYTQTVNDVMGRSHEQLMAESEDYRELVKTMSPDDAKLELANSTALKAAAITAPAAIAAGTLVSRFEGAPLSSMIRKAPGYVLREPVEEGIQGASGQLAQNLAIQGSVDENQDLAEGVGRQAGEGALYGLGMTAVLGAPSGAVQAVGLAGKGTLAVGKTALGMLANRVDKQLQANKEASPLADKTVLAAATEAQAAAEVDAPVMRQAVEETDATPEQKAEANSYIDSLVAANTYDMEADATPELLKPIMGDVKNRVEAIQRVAQYVNTVEEGSPAQMEAGVYLYDLVNGYQKLINSDPEALQKVPQDHPARTIVGQYVGLMDALGKTPKVMDAIGKIQDALEKREAKAAEITDEMLETPEGQKAVNDVINVAILAPEKGNLETTERVLNQVSRGKLQISPEQKAALDTSVAMLRAVAAADKEAQALGETDPVSLNISTIEGEKGPSLTQHAKGIMSAWKAGDRDTAAARLVEFHNFAKGMSNKLGAINSHFAAGDPKAVGVGYQIYVGGKLKDSPKVWRVYPDNVGSIKMAQKVGREAKMLADVYNNLVTAFPDLKGDHLDFVPLDPRLGIPAEDFVAKYSKTAVADTAKTATKTVPSPVNDTRIPIGVSSLDDTALATRLRNTNTNDPRYEIYQAEMDRRDAAATLAEQQVAEKIAKAKEQAAKEEAPAEDASNVQAKEATEIPVTEVTIPAAIRNLSDEALNERLNTVSYEDPRFALYDAEMTRREDEAQLANEKAEQEVEAVTPASVKAQLTEAKQLPFLERITAVNSLLNKENINDIVEGSAELNKMADDLLGDTQGFTDAFNKLRVRVGRFISDELRSRMMDRFDDLMTVPVAQQDSGHTEEQIKFLTWLTKLADAQDKRQGDLLNMPEPKVEQAPATAPVPVLKEKPVEVIVVEESLEELDFTIDFDTAMQEAMVRDDAPMFLLEDTTTEAPAAPIVPTSVDLTQKLGVEIDEVPLTADELAAPIMEAPIDNSGEGVAALFPRIMGVVKGVFSTSYKLPKVQKTRTIGTETPIAFLRSALSNSANFTNLIGSSPKGKYDAKTAAAYSSLLDRAEEISEKLKQNLANKLATDYKKGAEGTTIRELALGLKQIKTAKGVVYDPFRAADTKSMSITEQINNTLEYNPELLEGAVLAGIQWFIDSDTRSDNLDEADVASMTGIERAFVSSSMVDALNTGTSLLDAKAALTAKILNYWGLSKENSGPIGYQAGVPEAIAGEIMRTFKELGWLNTDYYGVTKGGQFVKYDADGKPPLGMVKTLIQIRTEPLSKDSAVRAYPNALDMAVLIEPEEKIIIGDEGELAVSPTQMRNPDVKNTPQQLKTIANEQNTPYFLNLPMVNLFTAMGIDELKEAFIQVDTKNTLMNKNHRMSVEGQTQALASAFQSLTDTAARVDGYAEGGPLDQVPIRYAFNMSRVSRLQMLGKYTPQSNKLIREAIMPTRSVLDLTNAKDLFRFQLGLAQALGIKVHHKMPGAIKKDLAKRLDALAPTVKILESWVENMGALPSSLTPTMISNFKEAGIALTPVALHALVEKARYNKGMSLNAFNTSIYVEADGISNGPINAMMLFTVGAFTAKWLKTIAKGGMFIGHDRMTMNEYFTSKDATDLYKTTANTHLKKVSSLRNKLIKSAPDVAEQLDHLLVLMDLFMGSDMSFKDGVLTIDRGLTKNPLTITLYGSGAKGIAGNLVQSLTDALYERMSQTIEATSNQGMSPAEAMFGKQSSSLEEAQEKFAKFEKAFEAITTKVAVLEEDVGYILESVPETERSEKESSLIEFTLSQQELSAMRGNMQLLFVAPLTYAIKDTVGDSLLETTKLLRKATQVQSIFLAHAFKAELAKVLLEKGKDPSWNRNDFLTVEEVNKIKASIAHLAPNIVTEDQVFSIATGLVSPVGATTFGSALDGSFRSDPYLHAPKNAGVSGIPYMTIGAGDGLMMQLISTYSDAIEGTLKIFDGMNMPLDKIEEGSRQANAAVFESWSRNPLKAVYESYLAFSKVADMDTLFNEMQSELSTALVGHSKEPATRKQIMDAFNALPQSLNWAQQSIEARIRTLKKVNLAVDQMAAVGEPHVNKGTVVLDNSSHEAMEAQLNVIYEEEFADIQKAERVDRTLNAELLLFTESHATGVEVLPASKLGELTTQMPKTQAAVMKEIIDTMAAEGYRIVFGTPEQIAKFNDAEGLYGNGGKSSEGLKGYINIDSKVIYLHNNTTETFTHELIHAATFQAVLAHYLGTGSRRASMAVLRIEELMNQFLDLESSLIQVNSDVRNSYADAKAAIEDYLLDDTPDSKAAALNEFMAWTLANESLANIAKNTTATKFARIRESVLSFLKQLFNIKQEVGKDMLSNLLFNSTILIRSQPTVKERFTRTVLMQNSTYGDNDRLVRINESLNKTVGQYLKEKVHPNKVDATVALQTGIMQAYRVSQSFMAHGFDMNMQEASTFNTIVATLATEAKIDANAMSTAQKLYVHAMKNLSYVDFMTDPESTDPNVEALAREKFDVLSGKYLVARDGLGRSTLLPAFLALATVNEEFRAVLAKVPVPKNTHNNAGTLDALLENTGNKLTGKLSNRMSGVRKNSTNTQEAIDDLNTHIINIIETRETFFDQVASKSGGVIDRSNEIITNGMSRLSGKLIKLAKKSEKPGTNKILKFAAQASTGLAAVLDEEIAGAVADNLQGAINKSNLWTPVREMLGEFIGRTESNANVYDMIKAVLTTVQQTRQQYREHLPVLIRKKFSRELSSKEWGGLYRVFAKGDITALRDNYTNAELLKLMVSPSAVNKAIDDLQNQLKATDSANYALLDEKMRQLAQFMIAGVPRKTLLRNASALSRLLMTGAKSGFTAPASVKQIDSLVSLYALQLQSKDDMASLRTLAQDENDGLTFVLSYLDGQRKGEAAKEATAAARLNVYKGYIPSESSSESSIQVFDDSKYSELVAKSYERIGDYVGSSAESKRNRGYYYLPVASRSTFEQGIIQNVRETIGGVDATTGQTVAQTAGVIADPIAVRRILRRINSDTGVESLMPVFDDDGDVVAFERSLNPAMMERLGTESDLSKMLGVWRGRQVEESFARNYNETLINHLGAMLDKDLAESANNIKEYVDLNKTKDPVLKKAVSLFSPATKKYAEQVFHGKFMVRKELLYDVLGYHAATVGDFWTGNGRWSPETQKAVRNIAVSVFGNAAYRKLVTAESILQNAVSDVRVLIVVKSVIVPTANLISNVYQLISRGVPLATIIKGMGKKVAEVEAYTHARLREIEAEAELRAASGNPILERRLKTELQSIKDAYTRMSIWPLIKAGEFSGISDAGLLRADVDLTSGRLQTYMEQAAAKLPGSAATVGRYALVTKDTALFQGLQKAVEYGDFLAKAILFDDLTGRKELSEAAALARITEEFVNYSRLSGRFRGALENNGLLWFYNFKLRIVKIALSTIRNNPVHALLATVAPVPTAFGSVGMPTSDNFFTKLLEGTLGNSVGPGQALDSISLNPWINFTQ